MTKVNGKDAADVAAKQAGQQHAGGPAVTALKQYGWNSVQTTTGMMTFAHPMMGNTFHVDADGTLINADSGTKVKPDEAAEYLRGFHSNSKVQAEAAAKQKRFPSG